MATLGIWRKAYGSLKDTTKIGLAKVNSDFKDLDIAIVKATNHVEWPPKERHLRKIMVATSVMRPRADVLYGIRALAKRLAKTHNWTVALKTLIVIHRTLREGDPTFGEEILNFSQRGCILQLSNFKDNSSPIAWDCSAWVRNYALFLEERMECFRTLKYDIEAERFTRPAQGQEMGYSRTRTLDSENLLEQLPTLQQLLYRLIGCQPEGAAVSNYVIQYALALVLKESFKIYCAINDGIINLVDKFFEMPRHEAVKAFEIYKRAGQQARSLSDFYEICRGLGLARNFQIPVLREPPQLFLATMEEYIRDALRMVSVPMESLELPERLLLTYNPKEVPSDDIKPSVDEPKSPLPEEVVPSMDIVPAPISLDDGDLLGLNTAVPNASAIEKINELALAIVPSDDAPSFEGGAAQAKYFDTNGWELALVTMPSNMSTVDGRRLAGGLDALALNSLYDEAEYRSAQQPVYGRPSTNPFEVQDPFASSNSIAPPPAVQMASMTQQQSNLFAPYQPSQQHFVIAPSNPFGDTDFGAFPVNPVSHPQATNPFGNTSLL